jgi:hypothetical protein
MVGKKVDLEYKREMNSASTKVNSNAPDVKAVVGVTSKRNQTKTTKAAASVSMDDYIYVINGFYESMRRSFTSSDSTVPYMVIEWDGNITPWSDFLVEVIGDRDPALAKTSSLRGNIFSEWQSLGLALAPTVQNNCLHVSSSAFESLYERTCWLGDVSLKADLFSSLLLLENIPKKFIEDHLENPVMRRGKRLFEELRGKNSNECAKYMSDLFKG